MHGRGQDVLAGVGGAGAGLQSGAGSAAARQRELNEALEQRMKTLEEKTRSGLEDARTAMKGDVQALREEHAKVMRQVERRLVRLEADKGAQDGTERASSTGVDSGPGPKRRYAPSRVYPQLVTLEAEPDEDLVYGDGTPVIVEWWRARAEFLKTLQAGTVLTKTIAERRKLELEIAIIKDHELTLPPATMPWGWAD